MNVDWSYLGDIGKVIGMVIGLTVTLGPLWLWLGRANQTD